jgi:glycerol transport system permease protein
LLLPICWLLIVNSEILNTFTLYLRSTFDNYLTITVLVYMSYVFDDLRCHEHVDFLAVALPAAYAFSRYSFCSDKHLFFWLLTNRMAPPPVFACHFPAL